MEEWTDSGSLYLRWNPSTDNDAVVHYEVLVDSTPYEGVFYEPEGRLFGTLATEVYEITVVAVDRDGNRSAPSEPLRVSGRDTTPPERVAELRIVERTAISATFAWDPVADDVSAVTYEIFVDDNEVATMTETSYTLTGLQPDSAYMVGVYVRDAAGNRSFNATVALILPLL